MLNMSRFGKEGSRFECAKCEWPRTQVGLQRGALERGAGVDVLMFGKFGR